MPRVRLYATDAERQAAYNERKREKERQRLAAEAAERQRVQEMQRVTRHALSAAIRREVSRRGAAAFLGWERADPEVVEYLNSLALGLTYYSR